MSTYLKQGRGMMLVDVMVALSICALFMTIIIESSLDSRVAFERARERTVLLDTFVQYQSEIDALQRGGTYDVHGIKANVRRYGNERIETDISIISSSTHQSIDLVSIKNDPSYDVSHISGTPVCSVDIAQKSVYTIVTTPIVLPIPATIPLSHLQVRNTTAYISADSNTYSDPDLYTIDIHDSTHPGIISSLQTGPGLSSFVISGNHIFASATSNAGQLHSLTFNSQGIPTFSYSYKIPLPYATATAPYARSIFIQGNTVFLGTDKWNGQEFVAIDTSDSLHATFLGGLETGSEVKDIYVRDGTAYLATAGQQQFISVDVSDPVHMSLVGSLSPSGSSRQEGNALSLFEEILNVGRTSGGFNIIQDPELFEWNASTTSISSTIFSEKYQSLDISGGVYGIVRDRTHTFVATRTSGKELQIFDTSISTSSMQTYALPASPEYMTCDGHSLYVLAHGTPILYKIDFK